MAKDLNTDDDVGAQWCVASEAGPQLHPVALHTFSAAASPPKIQFGALGVAAIAPSAGLAVAPAETLAILHWGLWTLFFAAAVWRGALCAISRPPEPAPELPVALLPTYTVIAPLYGEAAMVRRLADALCSLDYPQDKLQIFLALEADDLETQTAAADLPDLFEVVIAPPGGPRTKPRACNVALAQATGEFVVVYDAEDRPEPDQLRRAAAAFAVASSRVACLQAPLRVALGARFLPRQFALEYAALFEVVLPALARLGVPFPLGGTSNHFRVAALRCIGGWDPYNVTEDADAGFRLASAGYRLGVIGPATWELPPLDLDAWVPQRARWLKGYMQTWSVHMRRPREGGIGRLLALQATVGLAVISAGAFAPLMMLLAAELLLSACAGHLPRVAPEDAVVLLGGTGTAIFSIGQGARRAGSRMRLRDAALAPAYWALQSVALFHAVGQLIARPHHWDKTPHAPPEDEAVAFPCLDELAEERVSREA